MYLDGWNERHPFRKRLTIQVEIIRYGYWNIYFHLHSEFNLITKSRSRLKLDSFQFPWKWAVEGSKFPRKMNWSRESNKMGGITCSLATPWRQRNAWGCWLSICEWRKKKRRSHLRFSEAMEWEKRKRIYEEERKGSCDRSRWVSGDLGFYRLWATDWSSSYY